LDLRIQAGLERSTLHMSALREHSETKQSRYQALDGMRGLCAVLVALMHFDYVLGTGLLVKHGWLSVDVFFVLSGFVIAHKYEDRLQSRDGFFDFLAWRAARLLPVQVLGTLAVAVSFAILYLTGNLNVAGLGPGALTIALVYGLLLIPIALSPVAAAFSHWPRAFPINPPLWSLQAEWIVNLLYGRWFCRAGTRQLVLLWAVLSAGLAVHVLFGKKLWDLTIPLEFLPSLVRALIGFFAGVLLLRIHRRGLLEWLPSINPRVIYALWILVCLVPTQAPTPGFECIAALVLAPASVALLVRGERPLPALYASLGNLSYPLYASHFAIFNLASAWIASGSVQNLSWAFPLLLAALLLAWAINRLAALLPALGGSRRVLTRGVA